MFALVVDDSKATRLILGQILRESGFEVVQAGDGREGMDQLLCYKPRLALVDWNMPDMNGLEFIQAVRADKNYAAVCLLMVTSEDDQVQRTKALEAGADEYITKPFSKELLLKKLELLGIRAG
jgi:two-component system, chemotaxis family, chemotaxis protein CheY